MFGSQVLEVSIGLVLVFLVFSIILTSARELWEGFLKSRAVDLEKALRELFKGGNDEVLREFYDHPLIYSLYQGNFTPAVKPGTGSGGGGMGLSAHTGPSYIPSRNFALAVIDLMGTASKLSALPGVHQVFQQARQVSGDDMDRLRAELEAWYDGAMDRAAGWYRRRTQLWLFITSVVLSLVLNINAFTIARHLAVDKDAQAALVTAASRIPPPAAGAEQPTPPPGDGTQLVTELYNAGLPIGWSKHTTALIVQRYEKAGVTRGFLLTLEVILGYLTVGLAGCLGAPFWFDVLNKLMVIRSTVKPKEKSPVEPSKDPQPPPAPAGVTAGTPPARMADSAPDADRAVLPFIYG